MKAIYTKVLRNDDGKPKAVEAKVRNSQGKWNKATDNYYHHGAPDDYSHSGAAAMLIYRLKLDNGYLNDLRMADGETEDERIFI